MRWTRMTGTLIWDGEIPRSFVSVFFLTADQMLAKKNNTVESRGTYAFVIEVVNQLAEA
jgi:hypothetical protein